MEDSSIARLWNLTHRAHPSPAAYWLCDLGERLDLTSLYLHLFIPVVGMVQVLNLDIVLKIGKGPS